MKKDFLKRIKKLTEANNEIFLRRLFYNKHVCELEIPHDIEILGYALGSFKKKNSKNISLASFVDKFCIDKTKNKRKTTSPKSWLLSVFIRIHETLLHNLSYFNLILFPEIIEKLVSDFVLLKYKALFEEQLLVHVRRNSLDVDYNNVEEKAVSDVFDFLVKCFTKVLVNDAFEQKNLVTGKLVLAFRVLKSKKKQYFPIEIQ